MECKRTACGEVRGKAVDNVRAYDKIKDMQNVETDKEFRELLWKQYELNVGLYRSYLELALKVNLFYYAITGAILSFYFSHPQETPLKYALAFPLLMSIALGVFFLYGASLAKVTRKELFNIRDALKLRSAPEVNVLITFLRIFAVLFFLVALSLLWLLCFNSAKS